MSSGGEVQGKRFIEKSVTNFPRENCFKMAKSNELKIPQQHKGARKT